jgi:outer membrane protein assembly factor BamB
MMRYLILLAGAALLSGCSSLNPLNWWGGDEEANPPAELVELGDGVTPRVLWSAQVGEGTDGRRLGLVAAVEDGVVFVADAEGLIQARDGETGAVIWTVETELPLSGGPGAGDGLVLLGTLDGEVVALEAETGAERWRSRVASEVLSVPAIGAGVVAVHSVDGSLTTLDSRTGVRMWVTRRDVPDLSLRGSSSALISGGAVICGFADGKLVAYDLFNGRPLWEAYAGVPTGRTVLERMIDVDADPLLIDGVIYTGTYQGDLIAVAEQNGAVLWRRSLPTQAGLTGDWRMIYVTDTGDHVWAVQQLNGAAFWRQRDLYNRRLTAPALLGGYILVGDFEGYVHLLDKEDGSLVGRIRIGEDPITAPLAVDGDIAYVFGDGGDVAALTFGSSGL